MHRARTEDDLRVIADELSRDARRLRRIRRPYVAIMWFCVIAAVIAVVFRATGVAWGFAAVAFGLFGGQAGFVFSGSEQCRNARTLVRRAPIDAFPHLVMALEFDEVDTRAAVRAALRPLLPEITAHAYSELTR